MVAGKRSRSGHPLFVGGPQIGYFYPGLTLEMDLHGPGWSARGATSAPFPGYILIGRREDFVWTLTSAGADIVDNYVETLCDGSDTKYLYKGKCRSMTPFNAGSIGNEAVSFNRTVHGPVVGYATVDGTRVAISRKRSSYLLDGVDLLLFQRLTRGTVRNARAFIKAAAISPQTFNTFYADSDEVAQITTGRLPMRAKGVDSGPADRRARQLRVEGLPAGQGPPARDPARRRPEQLEQQAGARLPGAPTTSGRTARSSASTCSTATPTRSSKQHAGHAHRRDERGGHPGRAGDHVRADPGRGAARQPGAERAQHAHAASCSRPGGRTAAAASTATWTARSTIPARRCWTPPGRGSPTRRSRRCSGSRSPTSSTTRCTAASTCRRAVSSAAGTCT